MSRSLSQTQIIRSLGQALEWFEKEIAWGVSPGELGHLTGRIGELYAAMVTRGQMALSTNQRGYDVVSLEGERISVKTVTSSSHVNVRKSTFEFVDRVMVLRLAVDDDDVSIEEILDFPASEIENHATEKDGSYAISLSKVGSSGTARSEKNGGRRIPVEELRKLQETGCVTYGKYRVIQFENGSILVETDGQVQDVAKPILRNIAREVGIDILNESGNAKNTRHLGSDIIRALG